MWSPTEKMWSPKEENVESRNYINLKREIENSIKDCFVAVVNYLCDELVAW